MPLGPLTLFLQITIKLNEEINIRPIESNGPIVLVINVYIMLDKLIQYLPLVI